MRSTITRSLYFAYAATLVYSVSENRLHAAEWVSPTGGNGSWNSTFPADPGWNNPATPPNAVGGLAQLISPMSANATTVQDTGGTVTLGTINYGNSTDLGDVTWTITNTNGITLNQDDAGSGFATISNSNTNAGANNTLLLSTGTLTLADSLHVLNTSSSTTNNGAIQVGSIIAGTGTLVLNSSQPIDPLLSFTQTQGAIRMTTANTFTGTTTIERGLVAFSNVGAFGTIAANTITLGLAGSDSATLAAQAISVTPGGGAANFIMARNILIPAGNTGTLTLAVLPDPASTAVSPYTITYSGTISLGSNVTLFNENAKANMNSTGVISGAGGITKTGNGALFLNATHTYAGNTNINGGTVVTGAAMIPNGANKGNVSVASGATLAINGNEIINGLSGSGTVTTFSATGRTFNVGDNNATSTFSGSLINFNNAVTASLRLNKIGTGTLTLSGTNTYSNRTFITAGSVHFSKQVSYYNANATGLWNSANLGIYPTATVGFNVGGTDEFTTTDIDLISAYTNPDSISGFQSGSFIALDTTNAAGGNFVYGGLSFVNSGSAIIGLKKLGTNILTISGTSTYTGSTAINQGTLLVNGSHSTGAGYTVAAPGTLGGIGTISATATVAAGGHVAPGDFNAIGKLTVGGLNTTDGVYAWQLGALKDQATGVAGVDFDQLAITGNLSVTGNANTALDFGLLSSGLQPGGGDTFWNAPHSWKIIDTTTSSLSPTGGAITGAAGPGTWGLSVGLGADAGDIFLNYTFAAGLSGDVNGDHVVNQLDLNVVFGNWLATGAALAQGDANGDHVINQLDINTITGNWLATGSIGGGSSAMTVPEPSGFCLLGIGIVSVVRKRRKRSE